MKLPIVKKEAIFYEDKYVYACLANFPIVNGHSIVVWKNKASDLHLLSRKKYEHLMDIVDITRNALLKALKIKKVYLLYMDEVNQVHWHLIPRYNEKGYNVFKHQPKKIQDFSLAKKIRDNIRKI